MSAQPSDRNASWTSAAFHTAHAGGDKFAKKEKVVAPKPMLEKHYSIPFLTDLCGGPTIFFRRFSSRSRES
jgi:hypothetical protein